jgi:hypothetical protein
MFMLEPARYAFEFAIGQGLLVHIIHCLIPNYVCAVDVRGLCRAVTELTVTCVT